MEAGRLRQIISIEASATGNANALGERPVTWSTWADGIRAEISSLSGRELDFAKSFNELVTHRVMLRWMPYVLPTYRVNFNGRILVINGMVNVDERNIELRLYCTEAVTPPVA